MVYIVYSMMRGRKIRKRRGKTQLFRNLGLDRPVLAKNQNGEVAAQFSSAVSLVLFCCSSPSSSVLPSLSSCSVVRRRPVQFGRLSRLVRLSVEYSGKERARAAMADDQEKENHDLNPPSPKRKRLSLTLKGKGKKRFASVSVEQVEELQKQNVPKNTQRSTQWAVRCFDMWLKHWNETSPQNQCPPTYCSLMIWKYSASGCVSVFARCGN